MARSNEPIVWSLFSAGGVVAAFFLPVTIAVTAIAVPTGWVTAEGLRQLMLHPLTRLYLFIVISLPMFHWAHRFRYVLMDLGLAGISALLGVVCYGSAIVVTALAALLLVML